jgi:hypothetical protein
MTGLVFDVSAPVEVYDELHAAVLERMGADVTGLLVHLARATEGGFQVIDVWESREDSERYYREIQGIAGGPALADATVTEFEVHGLVIPAAAVAR